MAHFLTCLFKKEGLRLAVMEQILAPCGFIKVHRSYLANLKNVTSVDVENHTISFGGVRVSF